MVIGSDISASVSSTHLQRSQDLLGRSLSRLSSGSRIINPADDAAGMAVSARLEAQVQRLTSAKSNVGNAVSFTQTQDGYLKRIGSALNRMGELSMLSQDVTKTDADRGLYDAEFQELSAFITTAATKEFNGVPLFSTTDLDVTIDSEGGTFTMAGINLGDPAYTTATGANVGTIAAAKSAVLAVNAAINKLSQDRAVVGSHQARLNYTAEQLSVNRENLTAANSRIEDADVAEESTNLARANVLMQSGVAMLAQANSMQQNVLKLLQ